MAKETIRIKITPKKPRVGVPEKTNRIHQDKRTKRNRTRSDQNRKAINDK